MATLVDVVCDDPYFEYFHFFLISHNITYICLLFKKLYAQ